MPALNEVKNAIKEEFEIFNREFKAQFQSDNALLNSVNGYILQKTGKQIRPILTLLSAKASGQITDNTYKGAIAVEMLHTASLIHDDIVDDTYSRRGRESVNAIWKNKISILVGDYLLSQACNTAYETKIIEVVGSLTRVGKRLTIGEIIQLENSKDGIINEDKYIEVIRNKTAVLFSTAAEIGAITSGADIDKIHALAKFGELFGLCFQIKDDIFDYISTEQEIGKPIGNDIREGKVTLPLLYALSSTDNQLRDDILSIIKNKDFSQQNIDKAIRFAIDNGGIEYANNKMNEIAKEAEQQLSVLKDSDSKQALSNLTSYIIHRNF